MFKIIIYLEVGQGKVLFSNMGTSDPFQLQRIKLKYYNSTGAKPLQEPIG